MTPIRTATVQSHVVREYYWAGDFPVYVDNRLTEGDFDAVVARLQAEAPLPSSSEQVA